MGFHSDQIHQIQMCATREEYVKKLSKFGRGYPDAAKYLDGLDHSKTFLYSLLENGYTTHGHKTSNIAEIINNVINAARHRDPYHLVDFLVGWYGEKIKERQDIGKMLTEKHKLFTPYAQELLGVREEIARESRLTVRNQGGDNFLVLHECYEEGSTSTVSKRYHVDLGKKTCTCSFMRTHRIPCEHVLLVLDKLNLRKRNPETYETFMKEWIPSYFWAVNYVDGYKTECMTTPDVDTSSELNLPEGVRIVKTPVMVKKNKKRNPTKRKSKGQGGRRSRSKFDPVSYRKRKRQQNSQTGPVNPFVHISDPDIFSKKPCGRKSLTYQQRSEGGVRARQMLEDAISARQKKSSRKEVRSQSRSRSQVITTPSRTTRSTTSRGGSKSNTPIPIITTPCFPGSEVLDTPIPIITTPYFPTFDNVFLNQSMLTGYPFTSQPFPLILPNLPNPFQ